MLSRLVITFLPRSKRLLISRLQSPSTVILEPQKIKSDTVSPSICHEVMGPDNILGKTYLSLIEREKTEMKQGQGSLVGLVMKGKDTRWGNLSVL